MDQTDKEIVNVENETQQIKPVAFSAELDRDQLLAGQKKSDVSCHIKLLPKNLALDPTHVSTRINICLVFDCSTSMTGKMFESAIETAKNIVDSINDRYRLSLVAFNTNSHVVFQDEIPYEFQKPQIKNKIEDIRTYLNGTTNMAAGIKSAMDIFALNISDAKVIIMLSDGTPNNPQEALDAAKEASVHGVQIYAVGMGSMYQADQLLRMVTPSNGAVFGDTDERKISNIFQEIIKRVNRIFITDAKLSVGINQNVRIKQLIKTSPERAIYDVNHTSSDGLLDIPIGNIEDNKRYEFLLHLEVNSQDEGNIDVLSALIQYHFGSKFLENINLSVEVTKNTFVEKERNRDLDNAMRSASLAQLTDMLVKACSNSEFENALEIIEKIQQQSSEQELEDLSDHLDRIKKQLENKNNISGKLLNDFLLASSRTPENLAEEIIPETTQNEITSDETDELDESILDDSSLDDISLDDTFNDESEFEDEEALYEDNTEEESTEEETDSEDTDKEEYDLEEPEELDDDDDEYEEESEDDEIELLDDLSELDSAEEGAIFDIVLKEPGDQLILLARIIRGTTQMGMREIVDSIQTKNSLIKTNFKNKDEAVEFYHKLRKIGAKCSIRVRKRRRKKPSV
ncbi:MAG: ribosomal protein L7/L12 [Gammaproteobacteria bacterium]|nr:ribosomal protein L7/L12 [Gammaproteobacteria bacterium]